MATQAELIWKIATQFIVEDLEEWSKGWRPNGPSEHVMRQTINRIRNTPLPQPKGSTP